MVVSENSNEVISHLSDDHVLMDVSNTVAEPNDAEPSNSSAVVTKGGKRKGSMKKAAKENESQNVLLCFIKSMRRQRAKVPLLMEL